MAGLVIRDLASDADYAACVALQKETWGESFTEQVPATMLRIAQEVGGIAAGAFDDDELVGFVFGLTGVRHGRVVHWSDMLAVTAKRRDQGIGAMLKRHQRAALLARGIKRVHWTFDPLDAKNAHINFNRLGVIAREYVVDMYGDTASPLHEGIGTDRLIVTWDIATERVTTLLGGAAREDFPVEARVEIPPDIHALKRADPERALEWRATTRNEFLRYLPQQVVAGFTREGDRDYYELISAACFDT